VMKMLLRESQPLSPHFITLRTDKIRASSTFK
jgi:hypothetical protein